MTLLTVCVTCRTETHRHDKARTPDGQGFLEAVRTAAAAMNLKVRGTECLMGCEHGCNVAISAEGKMTYVLGRFDATAADADALVQYAAQHRAAPAGVVPFRSWPQGVKGHFIARVPPPDTPETAD